MLNRLNFLNLTFFLLISFVAPYVSVQGVTLAFSQKPEESSKKLEKDFFDDPNLEDTICLNIDSPILHTHTFPIYIELKPQTVAENLLRPPRFV
jgi:hypothetical protein